MVLTEGHPEMGLTGWKATMATIKTMTKQPGKTVKPRRLWSGRVARGCRHGRGAGGCFCGWRWNRKVGTKWLQPFNSIFSWPALGGRALKPQCGWSSTCPHQYPSDRHFTGSPPLAVWHVWLPCRFPRARSTELWGGQVWCPPVHNTCTSPFRKPLGLDLSTAWHPEL